MGVAWVRDHTWLVYLSMAVTFGTLIAMACCQSITRTFPTNYIFLFIFTLFEGIMVGFISAFYTGGSVVLCAGITAAIFLGLTAYAWTTKTDFTGMGPYLFGALLALMVFGMVLSIMSMCGTQIKWLYQLYNVCG